MSGRIAGRHPKQLQWKRGFRQAIAARYEISQNKSDLFRRLYANYRNGIIIFDDCRGYITSNIDSDKYFRHLLLDFRHKMLDIFFVVHLKLPTILRDAMFSIQAGSLKMIDCKVSIFGGTFHYC